MSKKRPHDQRMVSLSRRLVPPKLMQDPILRATMARNMEMDIAARAELKKLRTIVSLLAHAILNSSSGFRAARELRRFWLEYFERFMEHGPQSLPSSFNVIEAFMSFHSALFTFELRSEQEHVLSFAHYLDWYTAEDFPEEPPALIDIMEDGKIYSYDFVLAPDQPFLMAGTAELAVAGISLIRHQDELSALMLAGERPPVDPNVLDGIPFPGKEVLRPAPELTADDRLLEGTTDFSRIVLATRFNLSSLSNDVRYVLVDRGASYQVATDDLDVVMRGFAPGSHSADVTETRKVQGEALARYADLFSASASLMYLPAFFIAHPHDWHDTEFLTQLGIDAKDPKTKRIRKELGEDYCRLTRTVRCLPAPQTISDSSFFSVQPPEFEFASEGYWKALSPGQIGSSSDGTPVVGKTWVERTEAWDSTTPAEFLARRTRPPEVNSEYIYITRSPSHAADLYKVGMTTREVGRRIAELSASTAAPLPFGVLASWPVPDATIAEARVHEALARYRVSPRREFFRAPLPKIIQAIDRVLASSD